MAPVILITFAGRQTRFEILNRYIRRALELGIIDEWHVWDFTRSAEDHAWVTNEFGPARFMGPKVTYQDSGEMSSTSPFRVCAKFSHDLHIAIAPNDRPDEAYEIDISGWENTHTTLRKARKDDLAAFDRDATATIWTGSTPGVLSRGIANEVILTVDKDGTPFLKLNDVLVGQWPAMNLSAGGRVQIRGGLGGDLELCHVNDKVRRYIGNPNEQVPYYQAYDYYTKRASQFSDAIFMKCDDDIVYLDLDKLSGYIDFRRDNPRYFLVSANVLNNGVCAHLQQAAGALPDTLGHFEHPPGGFGGSLWMSPRRASDLHGYFLAKKTKDLSLGRPVIEWQERQSINFVAWLGRDLVHMVIAEGGDDEHALTVVVPNILGRPTAIYSDFVVSHLSFYPQEKGAGLDIDRLIGEYAALMECKLRAK